MDVRIGKRGQTVIPATLRRRLHLEEGDLLHAEVDEEGRLVLAPVPTDPVERLRRAGAGLYEGVDPVEYQRRLRDEWPE